MSPYFPNQLAVIYLIKISYFEQYFNTAQNWKAIKPEFYLLRKWLHLHQLEDIFKFTCKFTFKFTWKFKFAFFFLVLSHMGEWSLADYWQEVEGFQWPLLVFEFDFMVDIHCSAQKTPSVMLSIQFCTNAR